MRSLAHTISGARFGGKMFAVPREQVVDERPPALGADVLHQFGPYVVLSLLGLVVLACHRPLLAALTAACAAVVIVTVYRGLSPQLPLRLLQVAA